MNKDIKTWQERMGVPEWVGPDEGRAEHFMCAEIKYLRAYIAELEAQNEAHCVRCDEMRDALFECKIKLGARPELTVWVGPMPETNGKSNFTAILNRKGAEGLDKFGGFTIARSEYPDRVRYEADCVRYLIGELEEEPFILDYDADKHSGYVPAIRE